MFARECPKCQSTDLSVAPYVLTSYPPQYPHRCNLCGHQWNEMGRLPQTDPDGWYRLKQEGNKPDAKE